MGGREQGARQERCRIGPDGSSAQDGGRMQFCYPGPMPQPRLGKRCIRCLIRVCRDHMGHQPAELFLFFDREASHKACELACECVIEILDQRGSTCGQPELLLPSIRRILPSTDISMAHQPINRSAGSGLGDRKSVGHVRNGERSLIQLQSYFSSNCKHSLSPYLQPG